jgi:hypothetical protein
VRFDIDAPKNGDGIVYNKSDCGETNVRFYGFGGDGPGSACGTWSLDTWMRYFIWYANPTGGEDKDNYNWTYKEVREDIQSILVKNNWCRWNNLIGKWVESCDRN